MATLQARLSSLITAIKTETKAIRTLISGTPAGDVTALATTATNVVAAINEVKVTADGAASSTTTINDAATNLTNVWSSQKISNELAATLTSANTNTTTAVAAALEGQDLSTLAAQVTANAQADAGFVSFAGVQTLTAPEITQFNANIGIGEPNTDFVAVWNAA